MWQWLWLIAIPFVVAMFLFTPPLGSVATALVGIAVLASWGTMLNRRLAKKSEESARYAQDLAAIRESAQSQSRAAG